MRLEAGVIATYRQSPPQEILHLSSVGRDKHVQDDDGDAKQKELADHLAPPSQMKDSAFLIECAGSR